MTGLVYVWLEVKHRRAMWVVGFVMSACYVAVFGLKGLYASMGLYVYYLGMSVYGWLKWGEQVTGGEELRPVRIGGRQAGGAGGLLVVSFAVMWGVLRWFTDHPAPAMDAAITALNITATWLLAHSVLEQWLLLILANAMAIGLYAWSGLWFTTALYLVLFVSSFIGYGSWRRKIV